jgi:hypothetical protein
MDSARAYPQAPAWASFLLSILAFVSYFTVLVRFPVTRDVAWVNFLLFGAAALFFLAGLKRAFTGLGSLGGKFVIFVLALLSISILSLFWFVVFRATRQLPASHGAPTVGQKALDFTLRDSRGNGHDMLAQPSSCWMPRVWCDG